MTKVPRSAAARAGSLLVPGLLGLGLAAPLRAQTPISTAVNPTVTFATPGDHVVTLTVCNAAGCTTATQTVHVLDPRPAITSALVAAPRVEVGQLVRFAGAGTGQPALAFDWQVSLGGAQVADLPGGTTYWDTTGMAPGLYTVALHLQNPAGAVDSLPFPLVVTASAPEDFYTVTPCRVLDTRAGSPLLAGAAPRSIDVAGAACGIPAAARAIAANLTVVAPTGAGHATLFPGNYPQPGTSNINFGPGTTRANFAVLPLATDGTGTLAATTAIANGGSVHLILDVTGYFLAAP
jgi:PKD repeat protein